MKEIFIILAYTPKQEQQVQLRNLVYKLKSNGKKVMIMSHDHTPTDIVKSADYYFYDSDNLLVPAWKTTGNWIWGVDKAYVVTHFNLFQYNNYSIPYSKSLYTGMNLSKLFGYDIAHTLVYDTIIEEYDEFDSNNKSLESYDCVAYNFRTDEEPMPIGHFMSFNLNNYSYDELKWDEDKLVKELQLTNGYMVEFSSLINLILPKKHLLKKESDIDTSKLILNLSDITPHRDKNIFACLCVDNKSDDVWIFVDNRSTETISINFLINDEKYFPYKLLPGTYKGDPIMKLDNLRMAKVFYENKLFKEMNFENDIPKELFRLRSDLELKK